MSNTGDCRQCIAPSFASHDIRQGDSTAAAAVTEDAIVLIYQFACAYLLHHCCTLSRSMAQLYARHGFAAAAARAASLKGSFSGESHMSTAASLALARRWSDAQTALAAAAEGFSGAGHSSAASRAVQLKLKCKYLQFQTAICGRQLLQYEVAATRTMIQTIVEQQCVFH
jgi:hypothetical protein